ncbi:uncharacterized protein LOC135201096 [Macrobrachium nipponense]|uniref:uncharacterized protein LOC135201096 n=1 Tax=Macrobrachium nipponense TaxID=159736 RepID=UPI0030C7A713
MTPQVALLLAIMLAGVPGSGARGGKAGKGAGGGVGRYGYRGINNVGSYEMTWEDIVLAIQLSAMCFGALLALCIVACCAYKICGPAEEEDWASRYSVLKPPPRLPPELLREIYTLPSTTSETPVTRSTSQKYTTKSTPVTPAHRTRSLGASSTINFVEGGPRVTSVGTDPMPNNIRPAASLGNLPNGGPGSSSAGEITPAPPRRHDSDHRHRSSGHRGHSSGSKSPKILNLGCMLDGRPRLLTLSAVSSARAAKEAAGRGAANRLAAHDQHDSTLDLARAAASAIPSLSRRSYSESYSRSYSDSYRRSCSDSYGRSCTDAYSRSCSDTHTAVV